MDLVTVLRECGADDAELEHLVGCSDCRIDNDWEGARIARCPVNPITIAEEAESLKRREGLALIGFMGAKPQRSILDGLNELMDAYIQVQKEFTRAAEVRLTLGLQPN